MRSAHRITVLLADDHMIVREGLRSLLRAERDIEVVGEAANGLTAIKQALELHPAVVVMDMTMPQLNGLEATRQILKDNPGTKVLILSAHSDDAYVEKAMEAGASGYLIKHSSAHFLSDAIRGVQKGNTVFSPSVAQHFVKRQKSLPVRKARSLTSTPHLTSREAEVLKLTAEGSTNKEIAGVLGISPKTAEKHRCSLMEKLDLHDTADLTRYAIETGIVESHIQLTIVG